MSYDPLTDPACIQAQLDNLASSLESTAAKGDSMTQAVERARQRIEKRAVMWSHANSRAGWWDCGSCGLLCVERDEGRWLPRWFTMPKPAPIEWTYTRAEDLDSK